MQAASWTLLEEVRLNASRMPGVDWASYPILHFAQPPDKRDVHLIDRPRQPVPGSGEAPGSGSGSGVRKAG